MIRTFIYGSCVSRDTFERLSPDEFELVQYVARQSLISATGPAPLAPPPDFETSSPFQRRMLLGDWESSLLESLEGQAPSIDLLLWDLCDERLGLRQIESATTPRPARPPALATRSVDSIRAGVDAKLDSVPIIAFGSRRHRLMFLQSLRSFRDSLRELRLLDRTLVLAPAWASKTVTGEPTPSSFGLGAKRANRLYAGYYTAIGLVTSLPILRLAPQQVSGDPDHPWGAAPFHYDEAVYEALATQVRRHLPPPR